MRLRARNTHNSGLDKKVKSLRRNSGNSTTLPTPAAVHQATAGEASKSPMSRYIQSALRRTAGAGAAGGAAASGRGGTSGCTPGRSDRVTKPPQIFSTGCGGVGDGKAQSQGCSSSKNVFERSANSPSPPKRKPMNDQPPTSDPSHDRTLRARQPPPRARATSSSGRRPNGGQQPFGLISTVSSIWKGEEIGNLKV